MSGDEVERVHGVDCGPGGVGVCHRCEGAQPGNALALVHGAYSQVALAPAAAELAAELRQLMPTYDPAFEPIVEQAAIARAQARVAHKALSDAVDRTERLRLSADLRGWIRLTKELLGSIGLTPAAWAQLGLTLELTAATKTRRAAIAARYRDDGGAG